MGEIQKKDWDSLASALPQPLIQYEFLKLLEDSGSVCPQTGWQSAHFTLWQDEKMVAAAPLYIKAHSWGEFVFDMAFAQAAESRGWDYYPKLVGTLPLSPVPGWRILLAPGLVLGEVWDIFNEATKEFIFRENLRGRHLLWGDPEISLGNLPEVGAPWDHQAFLWENEDYGNFQDFLDRFDKNQRRNIRREIQRPLNQNLELRFENGFNLSPEIYEKMEYFYQKTNDQFGPMGAKFLTPEFFYGLQKAAGGNCWFSGAYNPGTFEPLALALILEKGGQAFGRYWGTVIEADSLHFNLCYYLPQAQAIERGWKEFDPGMGGEHKTRRGFKSVNRPSYHWSPDHRINRLFLENFPKFNAMEQTTIETLNAQSPFKN